MKKLLIFSLLLVWALQIKAQWVSLDLKGYRELFSISFVNADTGYVVGGCPILKTVDGGQHWIEQSYDDSIYGLNTIYFVNADIGYAVGDNAVLKTEDGGNRWNTLLLPNFDTKPNFFSVCFPTVDTGYVVGVISEIYQGVILKTTDGGQTWIKQKSGIDYGAITKVTFTNTEIGYAISDKLVIKTTDGGVTWIKLDTSTIKSFSQFFVCENILFATGYNSKKENCLFISTDEGTHWTIQNTNFESIYSLFFLDENLGYAAMYLGDDSSMMLKTYDGGKNWVTLPPKILNSITDIKFINNNIGYVIGNFSKFQRGVIYKTTNGGVNILENILNDNITIFPNPTSNLVTIENSIYPIQSIILFDVSGKEVKTVSNINNNKTVISLSDIENGLYIVKIVTEKGIINKKIIKN